MHTNVAVENKQKQTEMERSSIELLAAISDAIALHCRPTEQANQQEKSTNFVHISHEFSQRVMFSVPRVVWCLDISNAQPNKRNHEITLWQLINYEVTFLFVRRQTAAECAARGRCNKPDLNFSSVSIVVIFMCKIKRFKLNCFPPLQVHILATFVFVFVSLQAECCAYNLIATIQNKIHSID